LEIDVVFEEDAGKMLVLARVLAHDQIFQLEHVNALGFDDAVDQPGQVAVAELARGVRFGRP
jgi:hypothetical protein